MARVHVRAWQGAYRGPLPDAFLDSLDEADRARTDLGYDEAVLWVLDGNIRARRFYERGGWALDTGERSNESHGFPIREVRYRRTL